MPWWRFAKNSRKYIVWDLLKMKEIHCLIFVKNQGNALFQICLLSWVPLPSLPLTSLTLSYLWQALWQIFTLLHIFILANFHRNVHLLFSVHLLRRPFFLKHKYLKIQSIFSDFLIRGSFFLKLKYIQRAGWPNESLLFETNCPQNCPCDCLLIDFCLQRFFSFFAADRICNQTPGSSDFASNQIYFDSGAPNVI